MVRPAYSVDYDYLPATQLSRTMMTKNCEGLFLAGQVCETTSYEEASAQGLVSGVNAACFAAGNEMVTFPREGSLIGTLIDDLCTKELLEPYRVLTSRSEYRLTLRADNVDARMTPLGGEIGLIDDRRWAAFEAKQTRVANELLRLRDTRVAASSPAGQRVAEITGAEIKQSATLSEILRRPGLHYADVDAMGLGGVLSSAYERERVETEVKYAGYVAPTVKGAKRVARGCGGNSAAKATAAAGQ
eukprot:Plantae.Rhodophyta-Palmaria_palmata.ctg12075.p1 GENE.Plantae.Rhodophyta-Palmaria_palmata.ctg12075~~Plantae.Rhodophyta-Palmaria_palmata.ctg12075.p1  ORF type:complete len:245 (-),score=43.14 Plantae.Rhodophyta-Palmaria_palmata.ctg12075:100-834(-)